MIPDFGRIDAMFEEVFRHAKKTDKNTEEIREDLRIDRDRVEVIESKIDTLQDDVTMVKDDVTVVKEDVLLLKNDMVITRRDLRAIKLHTSFIKRKMECAACRRGGSERSEHGVSKTVHHRSAWYYHSSTVVIRLHQVVQVAIVAVPDGTAQNALFESFDP